MNYFVFHVVKLIKGFRKRKRIVTLALNELMGSHKIMLQTSVQLSFLGLKLLLEHDKGEFAVSLLNEEINKKELKMLDADNQILALLAEVRFK